MNPMNSFYTVIAGNWHLVNAAQFQGICNGTAIYRSVRLSCSGLIGLHLTAGSDNFSYTGGYTRDNVDPCSDLIYNPIYSLFQYTLQQIHIGWRLMYSFRGFDMHKVPQQFFGAGNVRGCFRNFAKSFDLSLVSC